MTPYQELKQKAQDAGFLSYVDYLKSDHWKALKRSAGIRKTPCIFCNERSIVGHHIRYKNLLDVTPKDLAAMCMECHDDFHLGCRYFDLNYIDMEEPRIIEVINQFRATKRYEKHRARMIRRRAERASKKVNKKSDYGILRKCLRLCKRNGINKATMENLIKTAQEILSRIP